MPITQTALTTSEIDELASATLSPTQANRGEAIALGRIKSPSMALLMSNAPKAMKNLGQPVQGGYRWNVKDKRGQDIFWWDGADILPFDNRQTLSAITYYLGKGHMGDEVLADFIERMGIKVDYSKEINWSGKAEAQETVVNYLTEHKEDIEYAMLNSLRKAVFADVTVTSPKAFQGIDGLFPVASNSTGIIGGRSRTDPNFRHQLTTGSTTSTIQNDFYQMNRKLKRKAGEFTDSKYLISCGDTYYDLMVSLFHGTPSQTGKADFRMAKEQAYKVGEKYGVALPSDCFVFEGNLIINEPLFEELDADLAPATPWAKRCYFINLNSTGFLPTRDVTFVTHPMPYNQRVLRTSVHMDGLVVCTMPNANGVMVAA